MENKPPIQDLGWENGWKATPEIVVRCRELGHIPSCRNLDPSWHGLHTEVRCYECGYVYHYDSSD